MMVTDTALHAEEGVPHLSPRGWFGIQDGGASSMVIGHNNLMKVIDHMGERGVKTSRFLFHPVDKVFAFGGDARREAQWSVRLPIYVQKRHGYALCGRGRHPAAHWPPNPISLAGEDGLRHQHHLSSWK